MSATPNTPETPPNPAATLDGGGRLGAMSCSAWLCREGSGLEYLLYLGAETKPRAITQSGREAWKWGNGFENVVIFTPKEWAKISPIELKPGEGPVPVGGGFFALPNA